MASGRSNRKYLNIFHSRVNQSSERRLSSRRRIEIKRAAWLNASLGFDTALRYAPSLLSRHFREN